MKRQIIIPSLIACTILFLIEQYLHVPFIVKSMIKLPTFAILPLWYIKAIKKETIKRALNLQHFKLSEVKLGLLLSAILVILIPLVYFTVATPYIDTAKLISELSLIGVTKTNFLFVSLYIAIVNSFLEEFFFRGFVFLNLYETHARFSMVFSALLFATYHIGIFVSWFQISMLFLALFSLFIGGLIFNFLATKSKNFLNSWLVHFFADAVILVLGGLILHEII